ncbi:hypothetical protein Celaphus_00002144, partial [Cervus elaphus hippelaphus]
MWTCTTVLSHVIAELGVYPAMDSLDSTSCIMSGRGLYLSYVVTGTSEEIIRGYQQILADEHDHLPEWPSIWCDPLKKLWPKLISALKST